MGETTRFVCSFYLRLAKYQIDKPDAQCLFVWTVGSEGTNNILCYPASLWGITLQVKICIFDLFFHLNGNEKKKKNDNDYDTESSSSRFVCKSCTTHQRLSCVTCCAPCDTCRHIFRDVLHYRM